MPRTLTASDRSRLIKLASAMPAGSPERRAILTGLKRVAAPWRIAPRWGKALRKDTEDWKEEVGDEIARLLGASGLGLSGFYDHEEDGVWLQGPAVDRGGFLILGLHPPDTQSVWRMAEITWPLKWSFWPLKLKGTLPASPDPKKVAREIVKSVEEAIEFQADQEVLDSFAGVGG